MKHIPDIIIAVGVIVGALGIGTGYRWIGCGALLVAMIVGWKRDWCMDLFDGMVSSSESSAVNEMDDSDTADLGDAGHGSDADGGH